MARIRNLKSPPIQEAVIDFLIECEPLTEDVLRSIATNLITSSDWNVHAIRAHEATFDLDKPDEVRQVDRFDGLRLNSPDDTLVILLHANRVTASHVKSYSDWNELERFAVGCLEAFGKHAVDPYVSRLGTRFINFINADGGFDEVLELPPRSVAVGGVVERFFERQALRFEERDVSATYTVGLVNPDEPQAVEQLQLVVDIDAYKVGRFEIGHTALSAELGTLRDIKNEIFFGAVKESALETYE